ncbi:bile acid:sodium symporter family protein [Candidatus Viridilinea mediisalina]|uniref:Transporter n=1 Tax=Candidatus Viridilinea mediisalina TaxID=2024553 RepID=A0A2A6RHM8_9CHLR|nr:bile acid:sodium symporter family protein [Candidatus Viridilinea mediisalina]PDW02389.1 transporter [Candidatus Viridilinea mediisalina]
MVSETEQLLLALMIGVIMLGMGSSLTWRDFRRAFKRPQAILIGFASQYLLMPLIGFILAITLQLPPPLAVGLILIASMPGGSTSNIFAYFSKGDLALSVTMTTFSTLAAFVMTPLALFIYASRFMTSEISMGIGSVIAGLVVMLIPVLIGMSIRKRNANVGAVLELIGGVMGVVIILALIALWVPRNAGLLATTPWQVYVAAIGIGALGFLFGFVTSIFSGLGFRRAATVSLETGIQNGPLALSVVLLSFTGVIANELALIPVLYSLFIVIISSFVTIFYRRMNERMQQRNVALL